MSVCVSCHGHCPSQGGIAPWGSSVGRIGAGGSIICTYTAWVVPPAPELMPPGGARRQAGRGRGPHPSTWLDRIYPGALLSSARADFRTAYDNFPFHRSRIATTPHPEYRAAGQNMESTTSSMAVLDSTFQSGNWRMCQHRVSICTIFT
jgi:hypothetical protein